MERKVIEKIFLQYNLGEVNSIQKIEIGFTNKVYVVNNKFILKVCEDKDNEKNFEKEVFFYNCFRDKIAVPKIKVYDHSKKTYPKSFMIYSRIEGDNLYSKWHLLSDSQRKNIIKQLCNILRVINNTSYPKFAKKFKMNSSINWHNKIINKIKHSLKRIEKRKIIPKEFIQSIKDFVKENHHALREQKIALVYWDAHFDNILVKNNKIVGILDFERTELASIDFTLDIIKRIVDFPKKYMSKESEKFAKKEDYAQLLVWFQEFYPELFDFQDIDKRLDLYAIEHDLEALQCWPKSKEIKRMLAKRVNYSGKK